MLIIGAFIQPVWLSVPAALVREIVLFAETLIVPFVVTVPQPPVSEIR